MLTCGAFDGGYGWFALDVFTMLECLIFAPDAISVGTGGVVDELKAVRAWCTCTRAVSCDYEGDNCLQMKPEYRRVMGWQEPRSRG